MSTLPGTPHVWRIKGVSDAIDGTNAQPGSMTSLQNLVPSPYTAQQWVPRPASVLATSFAGFSTPAQCEALLVVGNIAYGMIQSAAFAGKSQPFAYNILTNAFQTITGQTSASMPTSTSNTGDWTPPIMAIIGTRIMVTHPGFAGGGAPSIGWLDISGFSDATKTGNTNGNTTVNGLSANVLTAGWKPGMSITGTDIPANTTIVSIAVGGLSITISNSATGTHNGITFTVTGGTATSPQWASGNTNGNTLAAVPVAVANFNGRAYYAVPGVGAVFSDSANPTQVTNATQSITPNNGLDITSFGAIPLSQLTGGSLQALFAFQGDSGIQQITGDTATNNLAINSLPVGVGCLAPNTICNTNQGLAFVAPDGLRMINFAGTVSDPIGANGKGINVPFVGALNSSRMCAAFNQNVLRISVINSQVTGQPTQEYWLDFSLKVWSGPHTFPATLIQPYQAPSGANAGHGFLLAPAGVNAKLFTSSVNPSNTSAYTENGTALSWIAKTSLLPDSGDLSMISMVQTSIGFSLPATQSVSITAMDQTGTTINQVSLAGAVSAGAIWNSFVWGVGVWTAATAGQFIQRRIKWTQPLLFKQLQIQINGSSKSGFVLGNIYMRHEHLNYQVPPS